MTSVDIERMRRVAMVQAATIRASIEAAGMVATNQERLASGQALAYDEAAFLKVIDDNGIGWNAVQALLNV